MFPLQKKLDRNHIFCDHLLHRMLLKSNSKIENVIYKVLFKVGGTYIVLSRENVSVLSQLLKIDFDKSYKSFSRIKTIAFCRRHQAEEVTVKKLLNKSHYSVAIP